MLLLLLTLIPSCWANALRPDGALSQVEAIDRARYVSSLHYDLQFNLASGKEAFSGQVEIGFVLSAQPTKPINLDFAGGDVDRLQINGTEITSVPYDGLVIRLDPELLREGRNQLQVVFSHPYSHNSTGLFRFVDPADQAVYLYSHFEPFDANQLFPCFDQPDLKATYQLVATVPEHWQVISSNRETSVQGEGPHRTWRFPPSKRFSTYLFPLHAGPYKVWTDADSKIPSRLFARRSLEAHIDAEEWFAATRFGLKFFQEYFDYPYPYHKYDQLLVPEHAGGAMENVAAVTFSDQWLVQRGESTSKERDSRVMIIFHEMAHMWFGNLVTMRWWNGLWLNESFATYMAALARTHYPPTADHAWIRFRKSFKDWAYTEDQLVTTHAIETPVPDTSKAFSNFDGISYGKGASVLKQLSFYLGAEIFRNGIRHYFKKHKNGNTELADFFSAMALASKKQMYNWQNEWITKPGLNTVQAEFHCQDGKIAGFSLQQSAPDSVPTIRSHKTRIGLYREQEGKLARYHEEDITYEEPQTPVPAFIGLTCPDLVYPNADDFDYVKVRIEPVSLATVKASLSRIDDRLIRTMIWGDLWQMVRDGELGNHTFADLALTTLPDETDPEITEFVLTHLHGDSNSVVRYLTEDEKGKELRQRMEDFYWQWLNAAKAGSEQQKILLDGYLRIAFSKKGLKRLRRIVDGQLLFPGLEVDQDRRWRLLRTLAEHQGETVRPLVQQELKRDNSSRAQKNLLSIEAAMPDRQKKRQMFQRLLSDDALTLAEQRSIMWNLFPAWQESMKKEIADLFYVSLESLAKKQHDIFLYSFASNLAPLYCQPTGSERLKVYLKEKAATLNPVVLKNLRVALQEDLRCQNIRLLSGS